MKINLKKWEIIDIEALLKYAGIPQITRFMSDSFAQISTPEGLQASSILPIQEQTKFTAPLN